MVAKFLPRDSTVPTVLKERIEAWQNYPPPNQHEQYGPLGAYLHLKFPPGSFIVKPQARFRTPIDDDDAALLRKYGAELGDPLPMDEDEAETVDHLRHRRFYREISTDSTYDGFVISSRATDTMLIPDFAVCEYASKGGDDQDRVLLVMEISTSPVSRKSSEEANLAALNHAKGELESKLIRYMRMLGEDGDRWREKALGVAVIGVEVAFLKPYRSPQDGLLWVWVSEGTGDSKIQWFSLYEKRFPDLIKELKSGLKRR